VIREFGILNTNIPADHPFHGIPFPGFYLIAPDGRVEAKYFMPAYQTRATASAMLLERFDVSAASREVAVSAGDVRALIRLSSDRAFPGQELGVVAEFDVAPGWHIYGEPLPANYTPTSIALDSGAVARQSFDFPKPKPVRFEVLGETLPTYEGKFRATGKVLLKPDVKPGDAKLGATLKFQQCNDEICLLPQSVKFEVPVRIEPLTMPEPSGS
jgi:DsbC/DsbD-like thiol-disulfide interchange protein